MKAGVEQDAAGITASELRLPSRCSELGAARRYAREAAAAFGLDSDSRYEFVVAVNEAVTNAIRYGRPDEQGLICLSIVADADRLRFAVRDYGIFVLPNSDVPTTSDGGRGFPLMRSLMDEVKLCIRPGGTTVRFSKAGA